MSGSGNFPGTQKREKNKNEKNVKAYWRSDDDDTTIHQIIVFS